MCCKVYITLSLARTEASMFLCVYMQHLVVCIIENRDCIESSTITTNHEGIQTVQYFSLFLQYIAIEIVLYRHTRTISIHTWVMSNYNGPLHIGTRVGILAQCLINPIPLALRRDVGYGSSGREGPQSGVCQACQLYRVDEHDRKLLV